MTKEKDNSVYANKPWEKGQSFFKTHPHIPNMSVYNAIKMLNTFYRKTDAVDCLDLTVDYSTMIDDAVTISLAFKELGIKRYSRCMYA